MARGSDGEERLSENDGLISGRPLARRGFEEEGAESLSRRGKNIQCDVQKELLKL